MGRLKESTDSEAALLAELEQEKEARKEARISWADLNDRIEDAQAKRQDKEIQLAETEKALKEERKKSSKQKDELELSKMEKIAIAKELEGTRNREVLLKQQLAYLQEMGFADEASSNQPLENSIAR